MIANFISIVGKQQIIDGTIVTVTSFFINFFSSVINIQKVWVLNKTKHLRGLLIDCLRKFVGLYKSMKGSAKSYRRQKDHQIIMDAYHIMYEL